MLARGTPRTTLALGREAARAPLPLLRALSRLDAATPRLSRQHVAYAQRSSFHSSIPSRAAPTSTSTSASTSTSPLLDAHAAASTSASPSLTDSASSAITSLFDTVATVFEPFSRFASPYIHDLPHYFHLQHHPHGYAISLVLLAFLVRGTISLPIHLWMRARVKRLTEQAVPEWDRIQKDEEFHRSIIRRCRQKGLSHEQYQKEVERELLAIRASLFKKHRCTLGPTKWVPPLLNIPLFLALSFAIRQSVLTPDSPLLREILPWWSAPEHLSQSFETSAAMLRDRGLDPEALQKLSRPMGPTLGDRDGTNVAPLAVGLLTFLNLELATKGRETVQRIMRRGKAQQDQVDQQSAALAQRANYGEKREREVIPLEKIKSDEEIEGEQRKNGGVQKWASIGRGLSIASVTLATQVPGALLIYWLSSISYTLVQTVSFNLLDARTARRRVALVPAHTHTDTGETARSVEGGGRGTGTGRGRGKMSFAAAQAQAQAQLGRTVPVGGGEKEKGVPPPKPSAGEGQQHPSSARPAGPVRPAQTQTQPRR